MYQLKIKRTGNLAATLHTIASVDEASELVLARIEDADVGNSGFGGADVLRDGIKIGHVSYNGKVWGGNAKDWQPTTTLLYSPYSK